MTITATSDNQIRKSNIRNWTIGPPQLDNWAADLRHRLPTAERFSATGVTEHWIGLPGQSALMLAARITLPHFSASSSMNFPNAADVIDIGSTPKLASRAFMRGSAATALISVLSLSITSAGVSFGAPTPYHWFAS